MRNKRITKVYQLVNDGFEDLVNFRHRKDPSRHERSPIAYRKGCEEAVFRRCMCEYFNMTQLKRDLSRTPVVAGKLQVDLILRSQSLGALLFKYWKLKNADLVCLSKTYDESVNTRAASMLSHSLYAFAAVALRTMHRRWPLGVLYLDYSQPRRFSKFKRLQVLAFAAPACFVFAAARLFPRAATKKSRL